MATTAPTLTIHVLTISPPCLTVLKAAELKGLEHEVVALTPGRHSAAMREVYGEGRATVPGLMLDGEPVHGSRAILEQLEELAPFRPEAVGTFAGGGPLDPAGVDIAIGMARGTWKYQGITAQRLADDLAGLGAELDHVDAFPVGWVPARA